MEELRLDYEDFLRQRSLLLWDSDDPRREALVVRRCATVEEFAQWLREQHGQNGLHRRKGQPEKESMKSISSRPSIYPELAANAALILIGVACSLLDRQIQAQATAFKREGGFSERLYRIRTKGRPY